MRLPDFVILGAMKAGSTSLFRWLEEHPDVALPTEKEPAFFSRDEQWQRGLPSYAALFEGIPRSKLTGEASVHYSDPQVARLAATRLKSVAPDTKLIFIARDPAERLRSHYRHQVQRGREKRKLLDALGDRDSAYVRCSLYNEALEPWLACFGQQRLLVVDFDRLTGESDSTWREILQFLELSYRPRSKEAHNVTADKRAYSGLMRRLYDLGLMRYEKRIPRPVRRLLRPLAFSGGKGHEALLASSREPLPHELAGRLIASFAELQQTLGPLR